MSINFTSVIEQAKAVIAAQAKARQSFDLNDFSEVEPAELTTGKMNLPEYVAQQTGEWEDLEGNNAWLAREYGITVTDLNKLIAGTHGNYTITHYAADTSMGDTPADECATYRDWAAAQIRAAYPGYAVEVLDCEGRTSAETTDAQRAEEIADFCARLWDSCEWEDIKMYMEPNSGEVSPLWQWKAESASWEGNQQEQLDSLIEVVNIGVVWMENSLDDQLLKLAIDGAEDNNDINDANWSDWGCAQDILDTYTDGKGCDWVRYILDRAINSNGKSLSEDLPKVERLVWGYNFSGSFWSRERD